MDYGLWNSIHRLVSDWVVEHPDLTVEDLTDDIHDYIISEFGPPF